MRRMSDEAWPKQVYSVPLVVVLQQGMSKSGLEATQACVQGEGGGCSGKIGHCRSNA